MTDPNHAHEFRPNRRGYCQAIVSGKHCGLREDAPVHTRWRDANPAPVFEMDDDGNFRIVIGAHQGEWARYTSIATLIAADGTEYFAVSQYYDSGKLIPEVVYRFEVASKQSRPVKGVRP